MYIHYNYGTKGISEGDMGVSVCRNCNHEAQKTLFKEVGYVNLFGFIPLWRHTKNRGVICEHCGDIEPMDKAEYKQLVQEKKYK